MPPARRDVSRASAHTMAKQMVQYASVSKCPDEANCNPDNWKKWRVWGWDTNEAYRQTCVFPETPNGESQ